MLGWEHGIALQSRVRAGGASCFGNRFDDPVYHGECSTGFKPSEIKPSNVRFDISEKEIKMKAPSFPRLVVPGVLILAGVLLAAAATAQLPESPMGTARNTIAEAAAHPTLGNPAAVYCKEMGYEYRIEDDNGQKGFCALPDGLVCDAWEFLQGKCGQSYSYCAQQGYEISTLSDGQDPFSPEYAVCVTSEGVAVGSVTELSNLSEKATGCGGETTVGEMPPLFEEGDEYVPPIGADPPTSFDWRTYLGSNWLSPVKNQGSCGSCWSFSAVGATEAAHNIANNNPDLDLDLSEQYLVADCSSAGTCCGGDKSAALRYIRDYGVPDEACMPYVDGTGCTCYDGTCDSVCNYDTSGNCSDRTCANRCGDYASRLTYITSTGYVGTDRQTIQQALVDTGPLAVSMGWGSDFGGYWDGDIYRCTLDIGTNHAVVAVGYSDAGGYWIIKNSWGTGWEDGGYFKLGYGECYIEQRVYYADASVPDVGPLEYEGYLVDDDTSDQSSGNDNGIVDCGETIELYVDLMNQGTDTATGVSATISTSDTYITWPHNTSSDYPNISGGATGTNTNDYDFEVDPSTPDGHIIHFDLNITASNGGPWTDSFDVPVSCGTNHPPYTPSSPSPADGATGVSVATDLSWTGGDPDPGDTVTYDVYFGTTDPPTTLLCPDASSPTCDPGTLSYSTPYYWYVVATDNHGATTSGPVWDFATAAGGTVGPLAYDSHLIDDDIYGDSLGNDDGVADCGESIELYVDLINEGGDAATLVDAAISTSDPYVTWLANTSSQYPEIPGGGTGTNTNDYDFEVAAGTPDGHIIQFDLNITASNGGPWTDSFEVPVACSSACNDPDEPNDGPGLAVPISYGAMLTGRDICPVGDLDYYSFSGQAGDTIIADIDAQSISSSLDSVLHLYDTDEFTELAINDDFDGLDSRIAYRLPAAGTYYLMVREYNHDNEGGAGYYYRISLLELDHTVYLPLILRNQN